MCTFCEESDARMNEDKSMIRGSFKENHENSSHMIEGRKEKQAEIYLIEGSIK